MTPRPASTAKRNIVIGRPKAAFDADDLLRSGGLGESVTSYAAGEVIFSQGDAADAVMYVQEGGVKLSVLSPLGKEGVVAILEAGDFFGESVLAGRANRLERANAMTPATVLSLPTQQMIRLLHEQHALSDRFIAHLLARNIRIEEDLVDQLLNSSEKRLARVLLLLAHYGKPGTPRRVVPPISQQTLAEMIGTTRSRVNFFMKKFKTLGMIEHRHGLTINASLLSVILDDDRGDSGATAEGEMAAAVVVRLTARAVRRTLGTVRRAG